MITLPTTRTLRRLNRATALATLFALGATGLTPLGAQGTPTPEDIPIIDLAPVLSAQPETATETAPATVSGPVGPGSSAIVPDDQLTLPEYDRATRTETAPERREQALLLPLRADIPTLNGITRLSGEVQRAEFFVDLPAGATASELVIAFRVAINVLPEQSELRILVNGAALPALRPDSFEGFKPVVLPADLLLEGRNRISVEARHAHRIFCGPDATFAVWTEIDTSASGVRVGVQDLTLDPPGLALALRAQLAQTGALPVRLSAPGDAEILAGFSTRLAALRDGAPVLLRPEPTYAANAAAPDRARITILGDGPPLAEVRRGADGAMVLVLGGADTGILPDLDSLLPLPAPVQGNPILVPQTMTPLAELSDRPLETYNRYAELPVLFRMPEDWLTLASQKALLRLGYGFAEGLPKGALMLVKVNDTTVRLLPLDRDALVQRPLLDVGFPARLLRPGVNALTFVAIVPGDPVDQRCPPINAPLLTIDLASTLEVPPSPRMSMPGMDRPLRALRPDQIVPPVSEQAFTLSQRDTLAVLGAAMRPILGTERMPEASLTIATLADVPPLALERLGLTRRDLEQVLAAPIPADTDKTPAPPPDEGLTFEPVVWAKALGVWLQQLAMPGDIKLPAWLEDRQGQALMLSPDPAAPGDMWLLLGPDADPLTVAPLLARARMLPAGPSGQLSLLDRDGRWHSWHDKSIPPALHEPLTPANFREVAGNYASWSPFYFGVVLFGLTFLSVGLALIFIVSTRGGRKR